MPTTNIYYNTIAGTGGLLAENMRLAAMLENEIQMQLADMATIRNTNAVRFVGDVAGSGSDSIRLRYSSIGAKTPFSATADESTDVSSTLPTFSTATVTVARNALRYDISDLSALTGLGADLDPFSLAGSMAQSAEARLMQIICSTFSSAATQAGTTGVALSVDDFFDAQFALELANNFGEIFCVLHPKQIGHLVDSLRSESNNALAYSPATADMLAIKGQGYAGKLLGVDLWRSSYVALDGPTTGRIGAMFSAGGVAMAIGTPRPLAGAGAEIRPAGTPVVVELERDSAKALTSVMGHLYAGASVTESDRIVKVISSSS